MKPGREIIPGFFFIKFNKAVDSVTMLCYYADNKSVTLLQDELQHPVMMLPGKEKTMSEYNNLEGCISKKEVLSRFGISYGSLYRWKRMGLIPSEWFMKVSTSTGQETYFNEEVICRRIEMILAAKDLSSLEALSEELKPRSKNVPRLIIETTGGTRVFLSSQIVRVSVGLGEDAAHSEDKGSETIDISEMIVSAMQKLSEKEKNHE